ncbi:hypothetical protein [Luteimonas sp. MC1572]|uniref:hypothetical protein n=1 Tax=Luteimonas sp. MC1572 TaxID=2799325 RepID=UPI0018F0F4E6|nr:hypothetical protein [Luteimonas sp. MC1572]MBJ6981954.1 hypothetical protein [Luteimonas sp. MC1572]QQO03229.1 hypothetical protein JGR64_00135 [Luteimonas sp. MC1572]
MSKPIIFAMVCMLLAGCVQSAANLRVNESAGVATFTTSKSVADAYAIIQSNAVHCWADAANYIIASAPPSPARPPSIQINSSLGHLMSVVDFAKSEEGTRVNVKIGYTLGNRSRTSDWQRALSSWLSGADMNYCPRMP